MVPIDFHRMEKNTKVVKVVSYFTYAEDIYIEVLKEQQQ